MTEAELLTRITFHERELEVLTAALRHLRTHKETAKNEVRGPRTPPTATTERQASG